MDKKKYYIAIISMVSVMLLFPMYSEAKTAKKSNTGKQSTYTVKNIASKTYENRWGIKKISRKELKVLAKIVYLEAGNQGNKGEQAVIEVIFNRVAHKRFPNSITKVLSQRRQFTTWRYLGRGKLRTKELKNIYRVLKGKTKILSKKAVFFSRGPQNSRVELHYKAHYFCRY